MFVSTGAGLLPSLDAINPAAGRFIKDQDIAQLLASDSDLENGQRSFASVISILGFSDWDGVKTNWPIFFDAVRALHLKIETYEQRRQAEKFLNKLINDYVSFFSLCPEKLAIITLNLYKINLHHQVHADRQLAFSIALLNKTINKHRMLQRPDYQLCIAQLQAYKQKYTLTRSENIFRWAISINSGVNYGMVFYGIATGIALTLPVMIVSGLATIIAWGVIGKYFLNAYTNEDEDMATDILNHDLAVNMLAVKEGLARDACYDLIYEMRRIYKNSYLTTETYKPNFPELIQSDTQDTTSSPILKLDRLIDAALQKYPPDTSLIAMLNKNQLQKYESTYAKFFHASHWGPLLNLLSAAGTIFSVAKTILFIVGVTALAGSTLLLGGLVAGVALGLSILFAYKHFTYNRKSAARKKEFKALSREHLETLKIKVDQVDQLRDDLVAELSLLKSHIQEDPARPLHSPDITRPNHYDQSFQYSKSPSSGSPSLIGLFKRSHSLPIEIHPENSVGVTPIPKMASRLL